MSTPAVALIVDKLSRRASPALLAWMAAHGILVEAKVARARAPRTVQEVLDYVGRTDIRTIGERGFRVDKSMRFTDAGIRGAVDVLTAEGWHAVPAMHGAYTLHPAPAAVAAAHRAAAFGLSAAPWSPPIPAQAAVEALGFEQAGYFPVGSEHWVIPYVKSSIKGQENIPVLAENGAYRVPRSVPLPDRYALVKPPDWAVAAAKTRDWGEFHDYPQAAFGGAQARALLKPWVPKESRYGLEGVVWVGNEVAATDGNALHALYTPVSAPDVVSSVTWKEATWGAPRVFGGGKFRPHFNLTAQRVMVASDFPDFKQAVPSYAYTYSRVTLSPGDVRALLALAKSGGSDGLVMYHLGGFWLVKAGSGKRPRSVVGVDPPGLQVPEESAGYKHGPPIVGMGTKLLARELALHAKTKLPTTMLCAGDLGPVMFTQPGVQYGVIMPMRLD